MATQFKALITPIFEGAQAGYVNRWAAADFFDKVILANRSVPTQYWVGGDRTRTLPGLADASGWDGVEILGGKVVLYRDDIIKWSDVNDFTAWIPVSQTAISMTAQTTVDFLHPAKDYISEWIHLDRDDIVFAVGQFVRVEVEPDSPEDAIYNFYQVEETADPAGVFALSINTSQVFPAGETNKLFTDEYAAWAEGARILVNDESKTLQTVSTSRDVTTVWTLDGESDVIPAPDGIFTIRLAENPSTIKVGDVVSIGRTAVTGQDLYEVMSVGFTMSLKRLNVGTQRAGTGFKYPDGAYLILQPYVEVENYGDVSITVAGLSEISCQGAIKLRGLGYTGESEVGETIPTGVTVFSVDASEAGEAINAGSQINGRIFGVVALGEYGVILKERSIQTMQDVGRVNGTFFIRPEILDEGPISKNAWKRMGDKKIVFFGHKEIYQYEGGQTLTPIATQHTNQVYKELDRARADEIIIHHKEQDHEVWFVYPALNSTSLKVLIFNYVENSVSVDEYDTSLGGITALGNIDWEIAPTWESLSTSQIWETETLKWYEYVDEGLQRYTVIAVGGDVANPDVGEDEDDTVPRLLLHGRKFSRATSDNCSASSYLCKAETQDYDFGDATRWKYASTLQLDVEVPAQRSPRPMHLYIQLGSKDNLDSDIRWSSPARVEVSGNGSVTTKVNIRSAGRFLRIRFYSNHPDAEWRIAGFRLMARLGGTY